jgi:hypothetical protein
MTTAITVNTSAIAIENDLFSGTAVGGFGFRKDNAAVILTDIAGTDVTITFENSDDVTVNAGASLTDADTVIAAINAIVTA